MLESSRPEFVLIPAGDHIYDIDYRDLIQWHAESVQDGLNVLGISVHSFRAYDDILLSVLVVEAAILIYLSDVAPVKPSMLIDLSDDAFADDRYATCLNYVNRWERLNERS